MSPEDKAQIHWAFDQKKYVAEFGVTAFAGEPGYSLMESKLARPVLKINGISGGYAGRDLKRLPGESEQKVMNEEKGT